MAKNSTSVDWNLRKRGMVMMRNEKFWKKLVFCAKPFSCWDEYGAVIITAMSLFDNLFFYFKVISFFVWLRVMGSCVNSPSSLSTIWHEWHFSKKNETIRLICITLRSDNFFKNIFDQICRKCFFNSKPREKSWVRFRFVTSYRVLK